MQILSITSFCPRLTKSETSYYQKQGGTWCLCFNKLSGNSDAHWESLLCNLNPQLWTSAPLPSLNEHFVLSGESTNIFSSYLDSLSIVSCTEKMYTSQNRQIIFCSGFFPADSGRLCQATKWLPVKLAKWPPPPPPPPHRAFSVLDWLLCLKRGLNSLDLMTSQVLRKTDTLCSYKGPREPFTART